MTRFAFILKLASSMKFRLYATNFVVFVFADVEHKSQKKKHIVFDDIRFKCDRIRQLHN
jgi:hypothetical protein